MVDKPEFSRQELTRYSRQLALPEVGLQGQAKLKQARVLVVGAGGLGSAALFYLAAAGAGTIGIAEYDSVEMSNLQRQILYSSKDLGLPKAHSAAKRLAQLNNSIKIQAVQEKVLENNVIDLVGQYDMVLDGTDNIHTRYVLNEACLHWKKPYIYGAVYRWEGMASVLNLREAPCYCCLYAQKPPPEAVPDPAPAAIIGVVAGVIGLIQATEAIKLILTGQSALAGRLLVYDALQMRFDMFDFERNPHCPACTR